MNIAVCDDQPEVLDVVENMLREIPEVKRVETYQDIRRMRDEFEDGKRPDVLIMDICHEYNTKIPETEERQEGIDYAYELNQKFPDGISRKYVKTHVRHGMNIFPKLILQLPIKKIKPSSTRPSIIRESVQICSLMQTDVI